MMDKKIGVLKAFLAIGVLGGIVSCGLFKKSQKSTEPTKMSDTLWNQNQYYEMFPDHLVYDVPKLPENFHFKRLPNGLEVVVIEDHSVPLVTVEIAVHNGAFTEDSSLDGLSHLYEHMFFKANEKYRSQEEFMDRIKELGIVFNGTTSDERVNYFFTMPSDNWREGIEFMANAIQFPLFDSLEMKKENVVVAGEFQRLESNPFWHIYFRRNKYLWQDLITRKNAIGNYDVILNATPKIMREIQKRYYYPNNSILVIAGDVNPDSVFNAVEEYLGSWQPSDFDIFEKYPIPRFKPVPHNVTFIEKREIARMPMFMKAWQGPGTTEDIEATYAADVFFTILSQKTNRFQKNLVDSGYFLQVSASYLTSRFTGPISIYGIPNPQRINEGILKLREEIAQWGNPDYFTDEQLERAKKILINDWKYNFERASQLIHTFTFWWAVANPEYFTTYPEQIKSVTREDIKRFLDKYIYGNNWVEGLLIPPQMEALVDTINVIRDTYYDYQYRWAPESPQDTVKYASDIRDWLFLLKINPDRKLIVTISHPQQFVEIGNAYEQFLKNNAEQFGVNEDRWMVISKQGDRKLFVKLQKIGS
ncbi:MAG: insulinase family protein [Chlorobi bacterium]|nr:insulinase family protein [Chlorobiota bacterium]